MALLPLLAVLAVLAVPSTCVEEEKKECTSILYVTWYVCCSCSCGRVAVYVHQRVQMGKKNEKEVTSYLAPNHHTLYVH